VDVVGLLVEALHRSLVGGVSRLVEEVQAQVDEAVKDEDEAAAAIIPTVVVSVVLLEGVEAVPASGPSQPVLSFTKKMFLRRFQTDCLTRT
jgi:hypothetical protein